MESPTTHKIRKNGRRDFGYKNQFSYFYVLNLFLKKIMGPGCAEPQTAGAGWYICSAYQCLHLLVINKIIMALKDSKFWLIRCVWILENIMTHKKKTICFSDDRTLFLLEFRLFQVQISLCIRLFSNHSYII